MVSWGYPSDAAIRMNRNQGDAIEPTNMVRRIGGYFEGMRAAFGRDAMTASLAAHRIMLPTMHRPQIMHGRRRILFAIHVVCVACGSSAGHCFLSGESLVPH